MLIFTSEAKLNIWMRRFQDPQDVSFFSAWESINDYFLAAGAPGFVDAVIYSSLAFEYNFDTFQKTRYAIFILNFSIEIV